MPIDVAVITVHGINVNKTGYSDTFKKQLVAKLPKEVRPFVYFDEVFWADILRGRQQTFLNRALQAKIRPSRFRDLALQALGDAAAYQKTRERKNSAYYAIQQRLAAKLRAVDVNVAPITPLVLIGHSLGCHIISSFAWDVHKLRTMTEQEAAAQHGDAKELAMSIQAGSPIARLETFAGFITFGNNMPLFTFTFGPNEVYPITRSWRPQSPPAFPGSKLSSEVCEKAEWLNIYSPRDPLGFPLKPLNDAYRDERLLNDMPRHVERWWWPSPYDAHTRYWNDPIVCRETARIVTAIARAHDEA